MEEQKREQGLPSAIYARISRDRTDEGLGVERQEQDCRELANRLGWNVVAVFVDNDISAYSGAPRPQYQAMIEAVKHGEVRGVLAYHPDRLHRRTAELEDFVNVAEAHQLDVQTVAQGHVDLSTPSGRMVARIVGATAQHEVDRTKERTRRAKAQMAQSGKYRGGPRPYGFEKNGLTIREDEAQVIRQATKSIIAGRSLAAVARELNSEGLRTSRGSQWTYARLKDVLIRPRNAGLIAHGIPGRTASKNPRTELRDFEIVGQAEWPAIVPEEDWRTLISILTDPTRRQQDGNETRWLGSGIYECGLCGGSMRPAPYGGTPKSGGRSRRYLYRCVESAHLTVSAERTDNFIKEVVAELVRDPRIMEAMHPTDDKMSYDRERRATLSARLEAFERDYARGLITGAQLSKATADVTTELNEVDSRLAKSLSTSRASSILNSKDPGDAFLTSPLDVQRAVLGTVLRVQIQRATKRGAAWSPDRLRITPVTE